MRWFVSVCLAGLLTVVGHRVWRYLAIGYEAACVAAFLGE